MITMFQDCSFSTVNFKPREKEERGKSDADTQTTEYNVQDSSEQSTYFLECGVQTDEIILPTNVQYDENKLCESLKRMYPILLKELERPSPTIPNFDDFNIFAGNVENIFEIKTPLKESSNDPVRVIASEWKSESNTLCVGYSHAHTSWCTHSSLVLVFNLNISDTSNLVTPKKLNTSSCITSLAYHPNLPILAVATYSGEILIWDVNKEGTTSKRSGIYNKHGKGHKDTVTQISWIRNVHLGENQPLLATSGSDGFIILWQFSPLLDELNMCAKLVLKPPSIHSRSPSNLLYGMLKMNFGVSCFSFSPTDPFTFVAGMEGGEILKGAIFDLPLKEVQSELHLSEFCPVVGQYESHRNTVTDIMHVKRELVYAQRFVTSGLDKVIQVFEEGQNAPICIFYCKEEVLGFTCFEPEEHLILAWGSNTFHLYDIYTKESLKAPDFGQQLRKTKYSSVSSNRKKIVAIGNTHGQVNVWKLPNTIKRK